MKFVFHVDNVGRIQTAVICHPVSDMTHVREDRLLHCLRRLSSLLSSRTVVIGAGRVESYCADCLNQLAGLLLDAEIKCLSPFPQSRFADEERMKFNC